MFSGCRNGFAAALVFCLPAAAAEPPAWNEAIVRVEGHLSEGKPRISAALAVAPDLLAAILPEPRQDEAWRAAAAAGTTAVRLVARDAPSGFTLLAPVDANTQPWKAVALPEKASAPAPGAAMEFPGTPGVTVRCAGHDVLFQAQLLENPWLRVHLPPGAWAVGTPLTAGGEFAGLLAGPVPGVPDAARLLPARAVRHFLSLFHDQHRLNRAFLGVRLDHTSALPRVQECHASLPAERAGIQPGDVLLRIGSTDLAAATDAVEACFYLRVDEEVTVRVLRGVETVEVKLRPVPAPSPALEKQGR